MRRGDLVTVVVQGDFGKPRPALVVQSDRYPETATLTLLLVSGTLADSPLVRITVAPTSENRLRKPSQIMIDKAVTVPRTKVGAPFGRLDDATLHTVEKALAEFLELV